MKNAKNITWTVADFAAMADKALAQRQRATTIEEYQNADKRRDRALDDWAQAVDADVLAKAQAAYEDEQRERAAFELAHEGWGDRD